MKKFLVTLAVAVSALSIGVTNVEAKRLGNSGSVGKQSQSVSNHGAAPMQNQAAPAARSAAPAAPAAAAAKPASAWKGMLGGALLGLGLGALLSHFGLGGAMASMISTILMVALFALAAMFIYRMVMRRKNAGSNMNARSGMQPAFANAPAGGYTPEIGSRIEPVQPTAFQAPSQTSGAFGNSAGNMAGMEAGSHAANLTGNAPWGVPADFDTPAFLRQAKTYFIRLQAAWDKGDINDLREFTTTEMFAETKLELQERGASANHTDVVSLNAEMMGVENQGNEYLASVRFSGMIRESENTSAEPFTEVWNLSKPVAGSGGWLLAGIQQVS